MEKWVWILSLGCSAFFCGCTSRPQPAAYAPAVDLAIRLATSRMTNFKGAGITHAYEGSYEKVWAALLQFADERKAAGDGKIVAKDRKAGWIMTERTKGWL